MKTINIGIYWKIGNVVRDVFDYINDTTDIKVNYYDADFCRNHNMTAVTKSNNFNLIVCPESKPSAINRIFKGCHNINYFIIYGMFYIKNRIKDLNFDLAENVVVCHRLYEKYLFKYHNKVIFIPNAIDPSKILFDKYRESYKNKCVIYSLKFNKVKNYPGLIRMFHEMQKRERDMRLFIKAEILEAYREDYYNVIDYIRLGKLEKVIEMGTEPIEKEGIYRLMRTDANLTLRGKSIYINYSDSESFGYCIAEALLAGKQVFLKGWDNELNHEDFWNPYVCSSKKEMIKRILDFNEMSVADKINISYQNRKYVEDNFSVEIISKKWEELIRCKKTT